MWVVLAFGSAFFAGITSVLAKCGIKRSDSRVATAIRTIVVLIVAFLMTLVNGSISGIGAVSGRTLLFLILSGVATGASWLCYFKALSVGDVNKVVPIDKSSTVLTMILACIFFGEEITLLKGLCMVAIAAGTFLMIDRKKEAVPEAQASAQPENAAEGAFGKEKAGAQKVDRGNGLITTDKRKRKAGWLFYALLSAAFAAATSILGKAGIEGVASDLGTFIRTGVVLVMAWAAVFLTGSGKNVKKTPKKELLFIILSGVATGASWLCYYGALKDGLASVVVPIDKLSVLVTVAFSCFVLKEKLTLKAVVGLFLLTAGTLCMLI